MKNSEKQKARVAKEKEKAEIKEAKRLLFAHAYRNKNGSLIERTSGKIIGKPEPRKVFEITAIGLAKKESGKYKSRWAEEAYERRNS